MSFRYREQPKEVVSPKMPGEIDTRAPFQSVKAAVSLFGEVAISKERRSSSIKRKSSENVLEKETQLLLAQRQLQKIKKQLDSSEATKAKALAELDKANVTLHELTKKLINVRESKESAIEAAEIVKNKAKELEKALSQKAIGYEAWKRELEHARKEYTTTVKELDASKQELNKIRQDFDSALEAKLAAFQAAGEAQRSANMNSDKVSELSREIATMKESIEQLKLATAQAQAQQAKAMQEREAQRNSYKTAKEELENKVIALRNEHDPELTQTLETKLAETNAEIEAIKEQMIQSHASEKDSLKLLNFEIKEASKTLQDLSTEENTLRNLVDLLRNELEQVKKDQKELKERERAAEALAADLTSELEISKGDAKSMEENIDVNGSQEMNYKIQQLAINTEQTLKEEKEMRAQSQELKEETEKAQAMAEELEKKLEVAMRQAEEAKAAEKRAIEEMKILSNMQSGRVAEPDSNNGKIVLTVEEFAALSGKIKESEDLIDRTETASLAQVEAINARKIEVEKKVEANMKAIEEIKAATDMALRNAEMADTARLAVEGELKRWRKEEEEEEDQMSTTKSDMDSAEHSARPIALRI